MPRLNRPECSGNANDELRFVVCGSEDDGKSTLLERLTDDSEPVPVDDSGEEPERWIAGDVVCRRFTTGGRKFVAIELPDGERYTRSLVAGASLADLAVLPVDARAGVRARTRRDACIVSLMGIRRVILAVDGTGAAEFDEAAFSAIAGEFRAFADEAGIEEVRAVPVSTPTGESAPRYGGPTLMEALATVETGPDPGGGARPPEVADQFAAHLVWLDAGPMLPERPYRARLADGSAVAQVTDLSHRVDFDGAGRLAAKTLRANEVGYCKIAFDRPVPFRADAEDRRTGSFVLIDRFSGATVGAGRIRFALRRAGNVVWQELKVDKAQRARAIGQRPRVLWLTGLPAAGKSTIADRVEQKLQAMGRHTYLLDGDNVRHGLNRDLGFTDRDRVENVRRVAEVAKLMVDAGLIVIVSFISPFRSEREMARALMEEGEFAEIFVDTPLAVCEARDPKGLYAKARGGELANFTGIDSPYEPPETPDLRIDTTELSPDEAADEVLRLLQEPASGAGATDSAVPRVTGDSGGSSP